MKEREDIVLYCRTSGRQSITEEEEKDKKVEERKSSRKKTVNQWCISELTPDGQTVVRRFIPSNESQKFEHGDYLCLDSDDRVFAADMDKERVILLDSDLKWNRIMCPTEEGKEGDDKEEGIKLLKP